MITPRFTITGAHRRKRASAIPHQLAGCLSLLLAWGCSDDEGAVSALVDAGADGGITADASTPIEAGASASNSSSTAPQPEDAGRTSAPSGTSAGEPSVVDTTEVIPSPSSTADAPDSGASDATSSPDVDETSAPGLPAHCANLPSAPVAFEEIPGFTSSEDFVFDELGNYVGVDGNNNLVRISKDGVKQLWLPSIGGTAGMGILPDGSVVICDVGAGSIKRVYPNGTFKTILAGLEYPNGLDIGPDGYVYVAENNADRVRRVDPDTGEFTFVAIGLEGANGVAFSNDPGLLYVGSFEGSGVYRVEIPAPGQLGVASVLSRPNGSHLPEPRLACPDQEVGAQCDLGWGEYGTCQAIANVVDCFRTDPCVGEDNGESCSFPQPGLCKDETCKPACDGLQAWDGCTIPFNEFVAGVCAPLADGSLNCREPSPCDGHPIGDTCAIDGVEGVCAEWYQGSDVYCRVPQPCDGLEEGDACTTEGGDEGVCQQQSYYYYYNSSTPGLVCGPPPPCDGKTEGDECTTNGDMPGTCVDNGGGGLFCEMTSPCEGKAEGDACLAYQGIPGICVDYGDSNYSFMYCNPVMPCDGLELGAECVDPYLEQTGTCRTTYWGDVACMPPNTCDGLDLNAACILPDETQGRCLDTFEDGKLQCEFDECAGGSPGNECSASIFSYGVCAQTEDGLICDPIGPCGGHEIGDFCVIPKEWTSGTCAEGDGGLYCRALQPCEGYSEGDMCTGESGETGRCVADGDGLVCQLPCDGHEAGDTCRTEYGTGICVDSPGSEGLLCDVPEPCDGANEGDVCTSHFGTGTCTWVTDYYYPIPTPPIPTVSPVSPSVPVPVVGVQGAPVVVPVDYSDAGVVTDSDGGAPPYGDAGPWNPEPVLACRPSPDCTGKPDGEACSLENGGIGQCFLQQCREQSSPGGIDGLGVDACGYVYASEYVHGNVWRIAPDGTTELIAELPSGWIPNIKWGRGLGGFERDVMYIADRDQGRLFGMSVGGPGATEYYDLVNAQP